MDWERRLTAPADKGNDTSDFVLDFRQWFVAPHVAQKIKGHAFDGRARRPESYASSKRKFVEEEVGRWKTITAIKNVSECALMDAAVESSLDFRRKYVPGTANGLDAACPVVLDFPA